MSEQKDTAAPPEEALDQQQAAIGSSTRSKASRSGSIVGLGPRLSSVRIGKDCPANVNKLTSEVFNSEFPPMDWADMGLLIPHEAIRRQLTMMVQSVNALPDSPADNELWKATLFAKWYCEFFFVSIHEHHDAEEKIYFPFIKTKTEYPEKEFSKDHKSLMVAMDEMLKACDTICKKGGKGCEKEIALMKEKAVSFVKDMNAHLKEEEETIPSLLRDNFTQEEEGAIVEKIIQAGGLPMTKKFLPAVLVAMQEWATPEFYDNFKKSIPPPILHLVSKYYIPDFENVTVPMRDAPTMEKKPVLKKVGCCGISFCFPCIL